MNNDDDTQVIYALQKSYEPYFDVYRSFSAAQKAAERKLVGEITVEAANKSSDMWYVCGKNPQVPRMEVVYCITKMPILD